MSEDKAPVAQGQIVAGKYRIDQVIGSGGMGIVVAATQLELDRRVAIKFLTADAIKAPDLVARFAREARAAAKIQGEHVARVLDVGSLEDGLPYMVMEYLEGADLSERIAQAGEVPLEEIARYLLEACEALSEAHAAGIVHRDLKPANLFLALRPDRSIFVKLLDFGISKSPVGAAAGITSTQAVMGSPVYMSPEQLVSAKNVDARADVWSLGVVLYEALVGTPPFNADSMPQIVTRILHTPAPRLAEVRPDLPPAVDALVARCLEKDPAARFADVAELAVALAPFVQDGGRSVERITRVLGQVASLNAPPLASQGPAGVASQGPIGMASQGPIGMASQGPMGLAPQGAMAPPVARMGADAWGATQARIPRFRPGPWIAGVLLGACAIVGVTAVVVQGVKTRQQGAGGGAGVAPPALPVLLSATAVATTETLAPPPEAPTPAPITFPPPTGPAAASHGRPSWVRGHPLPSASVPATAAAAPSAAPPATAPPPTAEPDPLRMGIK